MYHETPHDALIAQRDALMDAIALLQSELATVEQSIDNPNAGWKHVSIAAYTIDMLKNVDLI